VGYRGETRGVEIEIGGLNERNLVATPVYSLDLNEISHQIIRDTESDRLKLRSPTDAIGLEAQRGRGRKKRIDSTTVIARD